MEEMRDKLSTAIGSDMCQDSVSGEDVLEIQVSHLFRGYLIHHQEEQGLFGESVDNYKDRSEAG
jgi:hypothetical protein